MTKAEKYFHQIIEAIPDVRAAKMFGALCMKAPNGKAAAMFWNDCIVVKLNEEALKEVLALPGVALFDPMQGRPMKEWAQIPFVYRDRWKDLVLTSVTIAQLESEGKREKGKGRKLDSKH